MTRQADQSSNPANFEYFDENDSDAEARRSTTRR
jgi:hypothetical protein